MEKHNFTIKYSFSDVLREDSLGDDPNDFVNKIEFEVYETDIYGKLSEVIAKGQISQILFGLAIDYGFPLFEVMDASESILDMSGMLFEFDEDKDFWNKLDAYFVDAIPTNYTICYLEYLEIAPKYRGKGIGKKIIRNIIERFYDSCGLWVVKGFPIQHSGLIQKKDFENLDQWDQQMDYNSFEKDFEKSQYKLFHYLQQLGFQNPFDMEYFIAQPFQILDKEM
jgi:ribosomal protein S18 acetylase RimI-like enzyme